MSKVVRAAILRQIGENLSVENIKMDKLAYGQVLVSIHYSGICRSQLMEQQGKRGDDKWLPHLLGHEGYGEVIEIGTGVTRFKIGDRVILTWLQGRGINATNPTYYDAFGNKVNAGKITSFSTLSIVSENRIFHAPKGFPEYFLALFGCALLTGGGMALKYGAEPNTKRICIIGFGGIGSSTALVLKGMKKNSIDIVDSSLDRQNQAKKLGFTNIYSSLDEVPGEYDLAVEATGMTEAIERGFDNLNSNGTLVFATHPEFGSRISLDPYDLIRGKRIFGTWGGDIDVDTDVAKIAGLLLESGSDLDLLIGEVFSIDEVNMGLAYLESGRSGRPLLKLNEV